MKGKYIVRCNGHVVRRFRNYGPARWFMLRRAWNSLERNPWTLHRGTELLTRSYMDGEDLVLSHPCRKPRHLR